MSTPSTIQSDAGKPHAVGGFAAIRLIAGRELTTRLRSKAFRIMTLVMLIVIVGTILVFNFVGASGPSSSSVGVLPSHAAVLTQIEAAGESVGQKIDGSTVADEATGRAMVADGDLDAFVTPTDSGDLDVTVDSSIGGDLRNVLTVTAQNLALSHQIQQLGGDPAAIVGAVSQSGIHVTELAPPREYNVTELVLGMAAGILIYLSLMTCGQWVAQGVVEEKSSRVVELLLATVRPWELMTGKVVGIGIVGLIQLALLGIVGVGFSTATGVMSLSISAAVGTVVWLIVWYLLGFVMYAFAFAGAGALVSRQEDAGAVVMPVLSFVIVGYVVGISVLPSDPSNTLVEVLSVIPLFAPTLMPMRLAMGGVPGWEAALALVLALVLIPLLAALAGRMYRNAVIHIGARVSLRKALAKPV